MIDEYIKKQMDTIKSLPKEHFIHSVLLTNGMRNDLANYPVLHIAMLELLSSGFTIKMSFKGTGIFRATIGKFEFRFFIMDSEILCVVSMNSKKIFEFKADAKKFYEFSYNRGNLYYGNMFLACYNSKLQWVDKMNIDKFINGN
ncbi:MAG: hypothetical protein IPJ03_16840 [Ignavibacteriales bacterium]|nr:hypothetical protein [Ignavibacteriales bacterium]